MGPIFSSYVFGFRAIQITEVTLCLFSIWCHLNECVIGEHMRLGLQETWTHVLSKKTRAGQELKL